MKDILGSIKELFDVYIKADYDINTPNRTFEKGEIVAKFDKIQIASLSSQSNNRSAHGGMNDAGKIFWDTTKSLNLKFTQGVFSKEQFALMCNSQIINKNDLTPIDVSIVEEKETNEWGYCTLKEAPSNSLFIYDKLTGEKVTNYTLENTNEIHFQPFKELIVSYEYKEYCDGAIVNIGQRLFPGFLSLEAKSSFKDNEDGITHTVLIKLPKIRLLSDITMSLGDKAYPINASFSIESLPISAKNNCVGNFYFLNRELT